MIASLSAVVAALVIAQAAPPPSPYQHGLRSGGEVPQPEHNCVSPIDRFRVAAAFAQRRAQLRDHGADAARSPDAKPSAASGGIAGAPADPPILYPILPMSGNPDSDIFIGGFVDLNPTSPGFSDYSCNPFTYDGHEGTDIELRSFAEQFIGVPVFAALDGVVTYASDGFDDTQIGCVTSGNIVAIDHGDSTESSYYHLKKNSVLVKVGEPVKTGQQIGMVGSSGCSYGPHLHFQTVIYDDPPFGYDVYEPFAGACHTGPSGWVDQPPLSTAMYLSDFGPTTVDPKTIDDYPFPQPRQGTFLLSDPTIRFWLRGYNLAPESTWRVRFYRPGGGLVWDSAWFFFNPVIYRTYIFWWDYDFQKMSPEVGTWHILVEFNDQVMINAPFEVVASVDDIENHAPAPIAVALDPADPVASDVIFARVGTSVLLDDLDYDIVRYHYVWKVNGVTVRDIISAAQTDAIARNTACSGATVQVTVTPGDGIVNGPAASATATVGGPPTPDLNCDGQVSGIDLAMLLSAWGACPPSGGAPCPADLNGSGAVNGIDLAMLLSAWGALDP